MRSGSGHVLTCSAVVVGRRCPWSSQASRESASWIGADYSTRFTSPEAVREWVASVPVAAVLLDGATPARHQREHLVQLRAALEDDAGTWQLARRIDVERDGQVFPNALEVWLAPDHARRIPRELGFDEVLGRTPPTP